MFFLYAGLIIQRINIMNTPNKRFQTLLSIFLQILLW